MNNYITEASLAKDMLASVGEKQEDSMVIMITLKELSYGSLVTSLTMSWIMNMGLQYPYHLHCSKSSLS